MKVEIERLDDFGRGIGYIENKICFIENALPEEVVLINIKKTKNKYIEAIATKHLKTSSLRIKNICPYFLKCGGCDLSHINYLEENSYKEEKVKNLLKKFSNLNPNIVNKIQFDQENFYRNKIVLHGKNKKLGLYEKESNDIVEIKKCFLINNKINEIIKEIQKTNINITEVLIRTSNDEKFSIVKIIGEVKEISQLRNLVDVLIINDKLLSKNDKIITTIADKKYSLSATSFFQVNKTLTKKLYDIALNEVKKMKPHRLLDLYCGTGTIGIYVSKYCHEIIGIDYNESNINDALKNKELNKLDNIKFICDKVENRILDFMNIDFIIVDPPRAGLDQITINNLLRINAKTITYISCNPITLIRDINILANNYKINNITPFNMFPRTHHVECVCVLNRK